MREETSAGLQGPIGGACCTGREGPRKRLGALISAAAVFPTTEAGGGNYRYQRLINKALREYIGQGAVAAPLEETLRYVIRKRYKGPGSGS